MILYKRNIALIGLLFSLFLGVKADQNKIVEFKTGNNFYIGKNIQFFIDSNKYFRKDEINKFLEIDPEKLQEGNSDVLRLGVNNFGLWGKFKVKNLSSSNEIFINFNQNAYDDLIIWQKSHNNFKKLFEGGISKPFSERPIKLSEFVFKALIEKDSISEFVFYLSTAQPMNVPIKVTDEATIFKAKNEHDLFLGFCFGIIVVMIIYNFILFLGEQNKSERFTSFLYVGYLVVVLFTQVSLTGWGYRFIWPDNPTWNKLAPFFFSSWVPAVAMLFARNFIELHKNNKFLDNALKVFIILYTLNSIFVIFNPQGAYKFLQLLAPSALITLIAPLVVFVKTKKRTALYFASAWIIYLAGVVLFAAKDSVNVPFNNLTNYAMLAGVAIETALLSLAVADKINALKAEQRKRTEEQNKILEEQVAIRTQELQKANSELHEAYEELQNKETELVRSEKMASLGMLTAGIAHEINNPINYVINSIKPLESDFNEIIALNEKYEEITPDNFETVKPDITLFRKRIDYDFVKGEIHQLLSGISEGARRTAEVVKGLRIFSRLDEADFKPADIHEGLDSTLVLLSTQIKDIVKITKTYGEFDQIKCFPGKLNQVFMNILSNSIYALQERFGPNTGGQGLIEIMTEHKEGYVVISFKDNGIGMDQDTIKRVFEPFFTTKPPGKGTGLGMAITYKIITEEHRGKLVVNSVKGEGTTIELWIPDNLDES